MIDFAPWERLLQTYVNTVGEVDYQRWQAEAAEALQDWLQALEKVELEALAEDERLALLLNLYNALVVQQILQLYPLDTIRPQILGVPNWVAFLYFFLKPVSRLGDRPISLNTLEHQLLRQQFQEPRMHFALVCAALGCPRLRNQAYWPDTMRSQLEADAQLFINNPAKVRYDSDRRSSTAAKSSMVRGRFLQVAPSIVAYIQPYWQSQPKPGAEAAIAYLSYDWSLNQRTSS